MITIMMTGMCEGCEYADLELDHIEDMMGRKTWTATCIHRAACDWMETRTIERARRTNNEQESR